MKKVLEGTFNITEGYNNGNAYSSENIFLEMWTKYEMCIMNNQDKNIIIGLFDGRYTNRRSLSAFAEIQETIIEEYQYITVEINGVIVEKINIVR